MSFFTSIYATRSTRFYRPSSWLVSSTPSSIYISPIFFLFFIFFLVLVPFLVLILPILPSCRLQPIIVLKEVQIFDLWFETN
jgi:hypothetical protein